ncbi:MAG TPA: SDR family oxidoreductase [Gaiellaceae bacterium]|nr:SDR family oxidoreductase [Gaiellaceae bacterium]
MLVTGASSGLGRACAVALARAGCGVALLARSEGELRETAAAVTDAGRPALPLPVDLANVDELARAVESTARELGGLDVLVNAAATDVPGPVETLRVDDWDRVLAVNLRAPFMLSKLAFPLMRRRGGGTIVNISSVAGKRGWADAAAYCASKFALTGLTQALAAEGREYGIRVCVLYPGAMATSWGSWSADERTRTTPSGQDPRDALPPDRVAALVVWLASAPPEVVLDEAVVTPLNEQGWP